MSVPLAEMVSESARTSRRASVLPAAGAAIAAALALASLAGWQIDLALLRRLGWTGTALFPLAALMLLALAGALASARLALLRAAEYHWNAVTWLCAALALAPALWTLAERALRLGASLELAFLPEHSLGGAGGINPGRSAALLALSVICISVSIGVAPLSNRRATLVGVIFGAIGVAIPFVALLAYADGAALRQASATALDNGLSLPTALALIALGAGMVGLRPTSELLGLLAGDGTGGMVARRMLPFALLAPLLLSLVVRFGRDFDLWDEPTSHALYAGIYAILLVALTFWAASIVSRADAATKRSAVKAELLLSKIKGESRTDGLTQLATRRVLDERLQHEIARAVRYKQAFSLLLVDIDHFKEYNDEFGHPEGDEVLRSVARVLRTTARSTDLVARYGGEEFAVVLACTESGGARISAERVRSAIEAFEWTRRPVTASVGAATISSTAKTVESIITAADRALYRAKRSGRNRAMHVLDERESDATDSELETAAPSRVTD